MCKLQQCVQLKARADLFLRTLMLWELTIVGNRGELPQHKGKSAAGIRRGKTPGPSPWHPHALDPQLPCGLTTHLGGCWHLVLPSQRPECGATQVPTTSPALTCTGHDGQAGTLHSGAGKTRGAQAFTGFHQTWSLGARTLVSNAWHLPDLHGYSGWGRSSCSCHRLPMPDSHGAACLSAGCDM